MAERATDLRRRITYLMLYRVVLITVVLGMTVALNSASPQELTAPSSISLFGVIIVTYVMTLAYAGFLPWAMKTRERAIRFADAQLAGDLLITSVLVHVTGGAQSGYTFFYPLSIVGAATVRHRRGAVVVACASGALLVLVAVLGWLRILPEPAGVHVLPWDLSKLALVRQVLLNVGACGAIGILAANLGEQLKRQVEQMERQIVRTADLAALKEDIIRCLTSGLLTIDDTGVVLTYNQAASDILRVAPERALGRRLEDLVPAMGPLLSQMGPNDRVRRGEVQAGKIALGVSVSPLTNHSNEPIGRIVNFQDLTELRRMEQEMQRTQRLAVIGGVAAGVAHEIRNPLAAISGSIELLKSAPQLDAENRALMNIVIREVDRLNGLVSELLDYARPRARMPMRIELSPVLDETARVFSQDRTFDLVKVRFEGAPCAQPIFVEADPAQLRQVAWNLLRNAAEAMPTGGEISVSLRDDGGWAEMGVSDTGVGIPPEELERIFEPFFTTKRGGNGLGLATVQRVIVEHGGTIHVASTVGTGTKVTVRLPVAAAELSEDEASSTARPS